MSLQAFLDGILDKKRQQEAMGWTMELIVLPLDFQDTLFRAVATEGYASDAYECGPEEDGYPVYLHGVKVLWSGSRLPSREVWFRYKGQKKAA